MTTATTTYTGVIRRYNGSKGFGFIESEGHCADTMFSRMELPEDAREVRGQIIENRVVSFDAVIQPDGRAKATRVELPYVEGEKCPGKIKSFNHKKGYGFVTSSCLWDDVLFDLNAFHPPHSIPPNVDLAGALVLIEIQHQPDAKMKASTIQFQTKEIAKRYSLGQATSNRGIPMPMPHHSGGPHSYNGISGGAYHTGGLQHSAPQDFAPVEGAVSGIVKSFSEKNGYGFITVPGLTSDVKFGMTETAILGGRVEVGAIVQLALASSGDGKFRATSVSIAPAGGKAASVSGKGGQKRAAPQPQPMRTPMEPMRKQLKIDVPVMTTDQWLTGMIKSYNPKKGFGFISTPSIAQGTAGIPGDVFFMMSNLTGDKEVREASLTGREVEFELVTAPDGQYRAQNVSLLPVML